MVRNHHVLITWDQIEIGKKLTTTGENLCLIEFFSGSFFSNYDETDSRNVHN